MHSFGIPDIVARWLTAMCLVLGTYNPYALSYVHWIRDVPGQHSLKVLVGVTLLILHVVAILSATRSLGMIGIGLLTALFASAAWTLIDHHVLNVEEPRVFILTLLIILSTLYGLGMSWSHLRNRIAGQVDSTDVTHNSPI